MNMGEFNMDLHTQFFIGVAVTIVAVVVSNLILKALNSSDKVTMDTCNAYRKNTDAEICDLKERMKYSVSDSAFRLFMAEVDKRFKTVDDRLARIEDKLDRLIAEK
jgi:hypothetical protein